MAASQGHPHSSSREWEGIRELRQEVRGLRRANERQRSRRRLVARLRGCVIVIVMAAIGHEVFDSLLTPSTASLAGLSMRGRIVAIATSQVGYSTDPQDSYCNKYSAYWNAGTTGCPSGETSEEWCADFAAWVWHKAGVRLTYGFGPGQLNARAASFYMWGIANEHWHPVGSGYVARPGDVAVYGLSLSAEPTAAHVAVVTRDHRGQRGPDVVNGDGDRTGFSVVETGTDQRRADAGHNRDSTLAGYVSP